MVEALALRFEIPNKRPCQFSAYLRRYSPVAGSDGECLSAMLL